MYTIYWSILLSCFYLTNMADTPEISLIISVYNNFQWLRLILDALKWQIFKNFEVIIADDGSSADNIASIKNYMETHHDIRIKHVWHEDKGWRKNIALNNAVKHSEGEYLVFIDGDCVPHPYFLYDHYRLKSKGIVMGGRRVESEAYINTLMENLNPIPDNFFSMVRKKILANIFNQPLSRTLSQLRRTIRFPFIGGRPIGLKSHGILGANFGIYRTDFYKVNGFDERYLHPGTGEDCDIDLRLENCGVKHRKASHYALMIHKCHSRLDWTSKENAALFEEAKCKSLTYTPYGLTRSNQFDDKIS